MVRPRSSLPTAPLTNFRLLRPPNLDASVTVFDADSDDPLRYLVWARHGQIHRVGDFAVLNVFDGTNISYWRFWVEDGVLQHRSDAKDGGFTVKNCFSSYTGNAQDVTG